MFKNFIIICAITFALIEAVLRLQQLVGPIYDLELPDAKITLDSLSNTLNHIPVSESTVIYQPKEIYGDLAGQTITRRRHPNSLRDNRLRTETAGIPNVLFLGDSFMEGYDDQHTLPQLIWEQSREDNQPQFNAWNVGHSSYSPAIFSVQVKQLIPALSPNLVVIDVDETDFADDLARYEPLATFSEDGCIQAISPSPARKRWVEGLYRASRHTLYSLRFLHKFMITRIIVPRLSQAERAKNFPSDLPHILGYADSATPRESESRASEVFKRNLRCMLSHLTQHVASENIIFIRHPHRYHLESSPRGYKWRSPNRVHLKAVAEEYQVAVYDSEEYFQTLLPNVAPQDLYWNNDMHLNFKGMKHYSDYLSSVIKPYLSDLRARAAMKPEVLSGSKSAPLH